jgi:hypothetical protein
VSRSERMTLNDVSTEASTNRLVFESRATSVKWPRRLISFCLYKIPLVRPALEWTMYAFQAATLAFYKDSATVRLIRRIYRENRMLVQPLEAYQLFMTAKLQSRLEGDFAEVGVYCGATAKLLCLAKGDCEFFGFDTFEGLPEVSEFDSIGGVQFFHRSQYRADFDRTRAYLDEFEGVHLVRGLFPEHVESVVDRRFSFVHLDVDLYRSTRDALEFFWPRLVDGGVIFIHDSHAAGVQQALSEFVAMHPTPNVGGVGSYHQVWKF